MAEPCAPTRASVSSAAVEAASSDEVDLDAAVRSALAELMDEAGEAGILIELELAGDCRVSADPAALHDALLLLLHQSIDAMPSGGLLRVRSQGDRSWGTVTIRDNAGVPGECLDAILEPAPTPESSGPARPGLLEAKRVVDALSGRIELGEMAERVATFHLRLPLAA